MIGTNAQTGSALSGLEHLYQSVRDIITTPIGTRVMRREYGSGLFALIDKPLHAENILRIYSAAATAIHRWEPRLICRRFSAELVGVAGLKLQIEGITTQTGQAINIVVVLG